MKDKSPSAHDVDMNENTKAEPKMDATIEKITKDIETDKPSSPEDSSTENSAEPNEVAKTNKARARAVGAQLEALREAKNWLLDDVCAQLKVSVSKLRDIEAGDLERLPDPAFAVGVVRAYAKMLGVDPEPLANELHHASGLFEVASALPSASETLKGLEFHNQKLPRTHAYAIRDARSRSRRTWIGVISIIALAVCTALYWYGNSSAVNGQSGERALTPAFENSSSSAIQSEKTSPSTTALTMNPKEGMSSQSTARASLHFKVSQDNWISVLQKDGKEIYSGILAAGSDRMIYGIPPFKVIVGNKTGLEIVEFNGQTVDPQKYINARQNVVHFELP